MAGIKKKKSAKPFVKKRMDSLNTLFDALSEKLQKNMNDLLQQVNTGRERGKSEIAKLFDGNVGSIRSALEKSFQEWLHRALIKMDIPTMDDLRKLEKKIDALNKRVSRSK